MLRVTRLAPDSSCPTLKVEGQIVSEWAAVLAAECAAVLSRGSRIKLDLADVSYIDSRGAEMLRSLPSDRVSLVNCTPLIEDLLSREAGS